MPLDSQAAAAPGRVPQEDHGQEKGTAQSEGHVRELRDRQQRIDDVSTLRDRDQADGPASVLETPIAPGRVPAVRLDWQPIETAPKDRTLFIGALYRDGTVYRVHLAEWAQIGFYEPYSGKGLHFLTHWMPLPDPPAVRVEP